MGYAGYSPGFRTEGPKTPLEQALQSLPPESAKATLDLMETLLRNVIQHPMEEKFRKIRLGNEKISKAITTVPGAVDSLVLMGWQQEEDNLVLPKGVKLDFPNHVNKVLEAKGHFAKTEARAKGARNLVGDQPPVAAAPQKPEAQMNLREIREQGTNGGTSVPSPAPADVPEKAAGDTWTCPQCTFVNHASIAQCEMCEQQRPGAAAVAMPKQDTEAPKSQQKSAFDFERKTDAAQVAKQNVTNVDDLRELRKQQYKDFSKDPNAWKGEQYQKPASTINGSGSSGGGWFDGWFGSGSSSSNNKPQGGGGGERKGPRMKTLNDLPKPVRRGG